jgi:inositol 1,4,5-triphosphate receptor type 1/inositol 1,4,5-triphosphate receptor type 3
MDKSQKRKRVYEAKMEAKHIRHQKFLDMSPDDEANFQKGYGAEQAKKVEQLWQRFLNELLGNQHFQDHQNKEQETIAKAIISIKKLLNPQFAKNVPIRPDVKMVSKKLILFLQSAFSDPTCKNTIDTLLKILKKIIEREVEKERKTEMQNLFDSLGAT